ncbi:MAG: type II toxin-antitoxin system RelE/ParE family toxin [Deltaproteobacteria bacterium]|nr:type II toxin-antitoxin system RelE/ParE family toxin [Deltaproteobacteria bacterium]
MRIRLHAEAEAELEQAAAWYDDERPGLGDELLLEARCALAAVAETPDAWPRWPDAPARVPPVRRFLVSRFPYALAYQVFPDMIVVLAVAHTSRRPQYWSGRVA